jgi:uncharacterized iron-regulated protein
MASTVTRVRRALALALILSAPTAPASDGFCPAPGAWTMPAVQPVASQPLMSVLDHVRDRRVVLLGEQHDNMEHHRWQLHVASALLAESPDLVLALEMFPRSVQPVLDRWVAGELSEQAFLEESHWSRVWRFDPQLYLPLFHFARMHRVPMLAMNVDAAITRKVSQTGFDATPELVALGVSRPAAPTPAYRDFLWSSFSQHAAGGEGKDADPATHVPFLRFVESQQVWDRAMAQSMAGVLANRPGARVVALVGAGHAVNGWGIEHQLRDLGIRDVATLLPSDVGMTCENATPETATALFGVGESRDAETPRPRLGVWLEMAESRVAVKKVEDGSVASAAGVQVGDVFVEVAGRACRSVDEVIERIVQQAPGSWLPIRVARGETTVELVAKFPPRP